MSDCWRCREKAAYRNQMMQNLLAEAQRISGETGKTMAIIQKSGCVFDVVDKDDVGDHTVKQYVSAKSSDTIS